VVEQEARVQRLKGEGRDPVHAERILDGLKETETTQQQAVHNLKRG